MTRKFSRDYSLSVFVSFIAILVVSVALVALAQTTGAGSRSFQRAEASAQLGGASKGLPMRFAKAVPYDSGAYAPWAVAVADLNWDGHPDVVVANMCQQTGEGDCLGQQLDIGAISVLSGNGDGTFQPAVVYKTGGYDSFSVAIGDVNGDGRPDLVVTNLCQDFECNLNGSVGVLRNYGSGFAPAATYDSGGWDPMAVAIGDVNGDGKADIVVANTGSATLGVLLGNGDGSFQPAVIYDPGGTGPESVVVADVNGDGKLDIVVANVYSDSVSVLLGNGDGTFQPAVAYATGGSFPQSVTVADVNGDHKPDLVVANARTNSIGVLLGNGDGTFQTAVTYDSGGTAPSSAAVADVNGGGKADIVVANYDSVGVLLGNGDGTFRPAVKYGSGGDAAISVAIADVNGDGKPDLLVGNSGSNSVGVLLNDSGFATTVRVGASPDPSYLNQPVTFTATVTSKHGAIPDGELVTFYDKNTPLASAPLAGGVATFTHSFALGAYRIKAVYAGDAKFARGVGGVTERVFKYPTWTVVTSNPNPSPLGQPVTFTVTVSSAGPMPTGFVSLYKGQREVAGGVLVNGVATMTVSNLKLGKHQFYATYWSDDYNRISRSPYYEQFVVR